MNPYLIEALIFILLVPSCIQLGRLIERRSRPKGGVVYLDLTVGRRILNSKNT